MADWTGFLSNALAAVNNNTSQSGPQYAPFPGVDPTGDMSGQSVSAPGAPTPYPGQFPGMTSGNPGSAALGNVTPPSGPPANTSPGIAGVLNQLLAPYGESTHEYQNAFLPDNSHPMLSNLFERALYGMAMTPGGQTAGESMNNIARGIIGVPRAMREAREEQMFHPLEEAGQIQNLIGAQYKARLSAAQTAQAEAQAGKENAQAQYYQSAGRRQYFGQPFAAKDADGKYYWAHENSTTGGTDWVKDPNGQKMEAAPKGVFPGRWSGPGGLANSGRSLAERMADQDDMARDQAGLPAKSPEERINYINDWMRNNAAATAGARTNATQNADSGFNYTGQERDMIESYKSERDNTIKAATGNDQYKQFRRSYAQSHDSLDGLDAAWQARTNKINADAYQEYNNRVAALRPGGVNTKPMPGKKVNTSGRPKVTLKANGDINVQ
jgi:hypothetical protein